MNVYVLCVHLESYCGISGRLKQMDVIFAHISRVHAKQMTFVLTADLNTFMHGVGRVASWLPLNDVHRFSCLGLSEAEWWEENVWGPKQFISCFPPSVSTVQRGWRGCLYQGLECIEGVTLNNDYSLSDHRGLVAILQKGSIVGLLSRFFLFLNIRACFFNSVFTPITPISSWLGKPSLSILQIMCL